MRFLHRGLALGLPCLFVAGLGAQDSVESRLTALEAAMARRDSGGVDLRAYWKDGLYFEAGTAKIHVGGRIYWDLFWISEDDDMKALAGPQADGTEFRTARLESSGSIGEHLIYKIQFDFADSKVSTKDVYVGLRKLPTVQNIRFGHYKEPMGLEELTSSRYITFMERSVTSSLAPSRNSGIAINGSSDDERINWALGWFQTVGDNADLQVDGNNAITGRVSGQVVKNSDTDLIHLGASASWRNLGMPQYQVRPENHQGVAIFDTGAMAVDDQLIYGFEVAWLKDELSAQAEFIGTDLGGAGGAADTSLMSFYIQASYFLSGGDHRSYKASSGTFARVKPKNPLSLGGDSSSLGAWEVALRYSMIDGDDGQSTAGTNTNITAGVNWYWTGNARWMINYVWSELDPTGGGNKGSQNALMMRWQVDF